MLSPPPFLFIGKELKLGHHKFLKEVKSDYGEKIADKYLGEMPYKAPGDSPQLSDDPDLV